MRRDPLCVPTRYPDTQEKAGERARGREGERARERVSITLASQHYISITQHHTAPHSTHTHLPLSSPFIPLRSSTTVGIGVVACVPTVMALVASNVPFVEVTTIVVVDPFSAVRRVPTANELAWRTATPMPCAPKSVDAMVSVVPSTDEMPRHPHGAPGY